MGILPARFSCSRLQLPISSARFSRLTSCAPWRALHTATKKPGELPGLYIVIYSNRGTLGCFFLDD
jgi:hypothetical protein